MYTGTGKYTSYFLSLVLRLIHHTHRGTEKLIGLLGRDVVDYLNKFRALDNLVDIEAWKKFCEEHPSKDLQSE